MPVVVLRVIPNSLDESSPVIGWKIRPSTSVSLVRTRPLITLHRRGGGTLQPPLWLKEHTSLRSPFGALRLKFLNASPKQIPAEKSHKRKSLFVLLLLDAIVYLLLAIFFVLGSGGLEVNS
ncbi:hypothetical protein CDAR_589991 [Caerostris darwini]|uniref:Uncharacterized protein n=1 Tax=Caerostris darwini TaxID=1538125 RepID=A0AAV4R2E8_9ARAC|nr:hypothetical protein CDAR_589991 [Caerostris darwini]